MNSRKRAQVWSLFACRHYYYCRMWAELTCAKIIATPSFSLFEHALAVLKTSKCRPNSPFENYYDADLSVKLHVPRAEIMNRASSLKRQKQRETFLATKRVVGLRQCEERRERRHRIRQPARLLSELVVDICVPLHYQLRRKARRLPHKTAAFAHWRSPTLPVFLLARFLFDPFSHFFVFVSLFLLRRLEIPHNCCVRMSDSFFQFNLLTLT